MRLRKRPTSTRELHHDIGAIFLTCPQRSLPLRRPYVPASGEAPYSGALPGDKPRIAGFRSCGEFDRTGLSVRAQRTASTARLSTNRAPLLFKQPSNHSGVRSRQLANIVFANIRCRMILQAMHSGHKGQPPGQLLLSFTTIREEKNFIREEPRVDLRQQLTGILGRGITRDEDLLGLSESKIQGGRKGRHRFRIGLETGSEGRQCLSCFVAPLWAIREFSEAKEIHSGHRIW